MSDKPPKKFDDKLPEGFEYSEEAKESLRKRAEEADQELILRIKNDEELKRNINELMKLAGEKTYE